MQERILNPRTPGRQDPDLTFVHSIESTKAGAGQDLAKLRLAGWIEGRRDGRRILYRVVDGNAEPLVDSVPYAASVAVWFMMASYSIGVNFPSRR